MKIHCLNAGYVELVESWGSDERIIEAARMSTNKGFQGWETDAALLAYLYRNQHATPFEMAGLVIEVKAPIFVFREWHRHRTQSYNEMSARYVPLPDEHYRPTAQQIYERANASTANKQAQGAGSATMVSVESWLASLDLLFAQAQAVITTGCGQSSRGTSSPPTGSAFSRATRSSTSAAGVTRAASKICERPHTTSTS